MSQGDVNRGGPDTFMPSSVEDKTRSVKRMAQRTSLAVGLVETSVTNDRQRLGGRRIPYLVGATERRTLPVEKFNECLHYTCSSNQSSVGT